jgi:hypothetical protein
MMVLLLRRSWVDIGSPTGHSEESSSAPLRFSRGYELLRALTGPEIGCCCPAGPEKPAEAE